MSTTTPTKRRAALVLAALAVAAGALALTLGSAGPAEGAFPGLNGKIAYSSRDAVSWNIWVMNADGSNRTYLATSTDNEREPAVSPDGSKIAYVRTGHVWVMNANGTNQTDLASGARPAWSPDGSKIAFSTFRDGDTDIYVMNADGSGQTNLTNHPSEDGDPDWSPDGSKIVFRSERDRATLLSEIYVMNADGSGQTNLTQSPGIEVDPSWSPDGSKIAYATLHPHQIHVMNADGSGQTNLSRNSYIDWDPTWSPDGSKIAFASFRTIDGNQEIYVMNADGTAQNNLTQLVDQEDGPSWGTMPSADLALSLVANPEVAKTQKPLTYTIRVDNIGPSNALGVVVTDDLPADQRFVSASPSHGSCQTPPVGTNGTVICNLGFVLDGQTTTAEIVVKVLAPRRSSVTNTASVSSSTPDPVTANNSATITTQVR